MTNPPDDGPYENSIRSNSPSGLGGIWSQLSTIATGIGSLAQIAADVASIRASVETNLPLLVQRLSFLTGSTAPSASSFGSGLPQYLTSVLGTRAEAAAQLITLYQIALSLDASSGTVLAALAGQTAGLPGEANILTSIDTRLNDANGKLNEQSSVLGFIGDVPAGKSIKAILQEQVECCQENGGGTDPNPPPTNDRPSPETRCNTSGGALRVSNFIQIDVPANAPDSTYILEFAPIGGVSAELFQNGTGLYPGVQGGLPIVVAQDPCDICIDWNFTGADNPGQLEIHRFNPTGNILSGINSLVNFLQDEQQSSGNYFVQEGFAVAVTMRVLQGNQMPGPNIWLTWQASAPV